MTRNCIICGKPVHGFPEEDCGEVCHIECLPEWFYKHIGPSPREDRADIGCTNSNETTTHPSVSYYNTEHHD